MLRSSIDSSVTMTFSSPVGGGGGLGRAFAEYWLSNGKTVIIAGRTEANLQNTLKEVNNPKLSYMIQDFSKIDQIPAFATRLLSEHPDLDAVVHNAGILEPSDLSKSSIAKVADLEIGTSHCPLTDVNQICADTSCIRPRRQYPLRGASTLRFS